MGGHTAQYVVHVGYSCCTIKTHTLNIKRNRKLTLVSPTACYKHYTVLENSLLTCQDKGAYTGDKSREERVKGKSSHQEAIDKLDNPSQQHVGEVGIHQLKLHWSTRPVLVEELPNDGENALRTHLLSFSEFQFFTMWLFSFNLN